MAAVTGGSSDGQKKQHSPIFEAMVSGVVAAVATMVSAAQPDKNTSLVAARS